MVDGDGRAHSSYHSQQNCSVHPHDLHDGTSRLIEDFSGSWHEYAAQFSASEAKFFVDGELLLDVPPCGGGGSSAGRPSGGTSSHCGAFFDVSYYLILNTAIGGPWPRAPDASTAFPGYHRIDWVRECEATPSCIRSPRPTYFEESR
jgi:hypothetical protein